MGLTPPPKKRSSSHLNALLRSYLLDLYTRTHSSENVCIYVLKLKLKTEKKKENVHVGVYVHLV